MRFLRRSLMGLFLLCVTAGLIAFAGNMVYTALQERWADESPQRPARERIFAVNTVTFQPETITPILTTFGEISSRRTLEVRSAVAGEVVWVADTLEDGGTVEAGALLARIDAQNAEGARDTAQADLDEALAELRDAGRTLALAQDELTAAEDQAALRARALARQQDLLNRDVGTAAAVETAELAASSADQAVLARRQAVAQAEARQDQARTALQRREIALAEAERRLTDTEIYAEFSGVLSDVSIVEGRIVSANERIAELVDPTALEVAFRVSTREYARLLNAEGRLPNAPVTVALDLLGIDIEATGIITRESAVVSDGQTGRQLYARLDASPGFRPGDFVTVRIAEPGLADVARLPASAVDSANTVLVIAEDDRLEVAPVELLRRQGDDVIVRASALSGRSVVAERTPFLGAGIRVRPVAPPDESASSGSVTAEPELVELDADRRAKLVAFIEGNQRMPADAKERLLTQLSQPMVPARTVARLEARMGG